MLRNNRVFLFLCCFHVIFGEIREPTCYSRFDYDEKMLLKLLKIEDKIQKFEDFTNEIKAKYDLEKAERKNLFDSEMDSLRVLNLQEIEKQKNMTVEIQEAVDDVKIKLEAFLNRQNKSQKDDFVAFTVTSPSNGPASNSLTFTSVVTNEGDGFDTTTGEFTCPVSGLYYFSLHIIKKRDAGVDTAGCYLQQTGQNKVRAYIDPQDGTTGADTGSYGVSTSVYLELEAGGVVSVGGCTSGSANALESWTTFSGFLASHDFIAFTVTSPSNGPASNSLTFTTVVTNEGDGFDTTTGEFTCPVSGLYYFSLHIIKKRDSGVDTAGCYLQQTGQNKVRAYIDPQDGTAGADTGSYGVSTSVYLELEAGGVVSVGGCTSGSANALESWTTFSGFLASRKA